MEHGSISLLNIENTTSQWNGACEGLGGREKGKILSEGTYYSKKMNKFYRRKQVVRFDKSIIIII